MSISGAIADFPLKDILQIISFSRKNGTLRITADGGEARVVFKMGAVIFAMAPGVREDFGSLSVRRGHTKATAVEQAVAAQHLEAEPRRPLGQHLLDAGAIEPRAVEAVVKEQIALALREMLGWVVGTFVFDVHKVAAPDSFGLAVGEMALEQGLDVQHLLLEAMKFFDDRARAAAATASAAPAAAPPPEAPAAPAAPPPPEVPVDATLKLPIEVVRARARAAEPPPHPAPAPAPEETAIDVATEPADDATAAAAPRVIVSHESGLFRDILVQRLVKEGLVVEVLEDPRDAVVRAIAHHEAGRVPVVVADLRPDESPSAAERVMEARVGCAWDLAVILLTDEGADDARDRAYGLGARHVLLRPEPRAGENYAAEIELFAVDLAFTVKGLAAAADDGHDETPEEPATAPVELPEDFRELLELLRAEDAATLTLRLLDVIGRRFARSILLHAKAGMMVVKGAYGTTARGRSVYDLLKDLPLELAQTPGFGAAFDSQAPRVLRVGPDAGQIPDLIGPPRSSEVLVIPITCHRRPVAIIYADTGGSGERIGDLGAYRELCQRVSRVLEEAMTRLKGRAAADPNATRILRRPGETDQ